MYHSRGGGHDETIMKIGFRSTGIMPTNYQEDTLLGNEEGGVENG